MVAHVLHEAAPLQTVHAHPGGVHRLAGVSVESPAGTRPVYLGAVAAMRHELGLGGRLAERLHAQQRWLERVVDGPFQVAVSGLPPLFGSFAAIFVNSLLG